MPYNFTHHRLDVTFCITLRGDLNHCFGVPIAAIKMLIDAAFRKETWVLNGRRQSGQERIGALGIQILRLFLFFHRFQSSQAEIVVAPFFNLPR